MSNDTLFSPETLAACQEIIDLMKQQDASRSNSYSGHTIPGIMETIRHKPYEVVAFFDKEGKKLMEKTSHNPEGVRTFINSCAVKLSGKTEFCVHNHTRNSSFSKADLEFYRTINLHIGIVVTPCYNFYVFRPLTGWPTDDDWIDEWQILFNKFQQYRNRCNSRAMASHLAMAEISQRYGIGYKITNLVGEDIPIDQFKLAS